MMDSLNDQPSKEEEVFINAVSELVELLTEGDEAVLALEREMCVSQKKLEELHPTYCMMRANIVRRYVDELKAKLNKENNTSLN